LWFKIESEKSANNPKVEAFSDYFDDTWLDDITPRFSRHIWNHWNNTDRRTNDLKDLHYALNNGCWPYSP